MTKKLFIALLGLSLVIQLVVAGPVSKSDSSSEESDEVTTTTVKSKSTDDSSSSSSSSSSSEEDIANEVRAKALSSVITDFMDIVDYALKKSAPIFEEVLEDDIVNSLNNEPMEKHKTKIEEFVKEVKELDKDDPSLSGFEKLMQPFAKLKLYGDLTEMLDAYNTTDEEKPDTEAILIESVLKKHDIAKLNKDLEKKLKAVLDDFGDSLGESIKKALAEKEAKEEKLFDLYKKYNAEKDTNKKMDIFANFVHKYNTNDVDGKD